MFTGIISHLGRIEKVSSCGLEVKAAGDFLREVKKGSSVTVNGACLTVRKKTQNSFKADLMPETFKRTALGDSEVGELVNLELPMRADGRFEGHIVQGHVDGTARVEKITKEGNSQIITFKVPNSLAKSIVKKGSIAVNGISLTVIYSKNSAFSVSIIPFTLENTMIKNLKVGDKVNIETDILAKYIEKLAKFHA